MDIVHMDTVHKEMDIVDKENAIIQTNWRIIEFFRFICFSGMRPETIRCGE